MMCNVCAHMNKRRHTEQSVRMRAICIHTHALHGVCNACILAYTNMFKRCLKIHIISIFPSPHRAIGVYFVTSVLFLDATAKVLKLSFVCFLFRCNFFFCMDRIIITAIKARCYSFKKIPSKEIFEPKNLNKTQKLCSRFEQTSLRLRISI